MAHETPRPDRTCRTIHTTAAGEWAKREAGASCQSCCLSTIKNKYTVHILVQIGVDLRYSHIDLQNCIIIPDTTVSFIQFFCTVALALLRYTRAYGISLGIPSRSLPPRDKYLWHRRGGKVKEPFLLVVYLFASISLSLSFFLSFSTSCCVVLLFSNLGSIQHSTVGSPRSLESESASNEPFFSKLLLPFLPFFSTPPPGDRSSKVFYLSLNRLVAFRPFSSFVCHHSSFFKKGLFLTGKKQRPFFPPSIVTRLCASKNTCRNCPSINTALIALYSTFTHSF